MPVGIEVCVDSAAGAATSESAGADRVELCAALITGGVTPSIGCIVTTLHAVTRIGIHVLIRPRGGDFVYDRSEVDTMLADITSIRRETAGSDVEVGFVIGALTPSATIDDETCRALIAAAGDHPVSFHRAFDLTADLDRSLDTLVDLGIRRVLTGGGTQRAVDGIDTLAALVRRADSAIDVMPGGSVRPDNIAHILTATGAHDIHFRAPEVRSNHVARHRPNIRMGASAAPSEEHREETSAETVREMVALAR